MSQSIKLPLITIIDDELYWQDYIEQELQNELNKEKLLEKNKKESQNK